MKKFIGLTIVCFALAACSTQPSPAAPDATAPATPAANMPNPASVFCKENGNTLEIQTAADGSQSGLCIFPDGSTCDEWAFFRGECGPTPQTNPTPTTADQATPKAGDDDAGENSTGGSIPPGTAEEITDWWGVIQSTEPGAQFDDRFERRDLGQPIYFGIDASDPAIQSQIEALRDSGKIVHLYGTLLSNVLDVNGSQILVDRMEIEED